MYSLRHDRGMVTRPMATTNKTQKIKSTVRDIANARIKKKMAELFELFVANRQAGASNAEFVSILQEILST